MRRRYMTSAGYVVYVKPSRSIRSNGGYIRPEAADGCDIVDVSPNSAGMGQIAIIGGDLTAMSNPQGTVTGTSSESRGKAIRGRADGGDNRGVDPGEGRGQHGRFETRLDAVVEGFIGEFLLGESASGGGNTIGSKDREEDGEDLRVTVDENGVGVVDGAGGEGLKE